jgi:RNA polymerase sigma-70 factor (ECF subfamily)
VTAGSEARLSPRDGELVSALRRGDEAAFVTLVDELGPVMLRLALQLVPSRAVAEEVVQDAWLAVLRGLDRFEGRSSLKTWVLQIVLNIARTKGRRERRIVPFAAFRRRGEEGRDEPAVDPDRFLPASHPERPGWWSRPPSAWGVPDEQLVTGETCQAILREIAALPARQREVITLRDVAGCPAEEVCDLLDLTDANQRVLLHRARSKVRAAIERQLGADVA